MRVAFDTAPLVRPYPPGVVRACRGLVEALKSSGRLEIVELAPAEGEGERAWRQRCLPRLARQAGCAGVHSPVSAFPWFGEGRRVYTVHELPWRHGARENAGLRHRFWARLGTRRADATLCPTELVRRDLLAEAPRRAERVHVCSWGSSEEPTSGTTVDLPGPFVLALGATRAKKNLAASLRGLSALASSNESPLQLVVTGEEAEESAPDLRLARELGLEERVHRLGHVDEATRQALLRQASALVVLSRSEGFGFPVLEALAAGRPVVVREGSAAAEVAGSCGIVVDSEDPPAVAAALQAAVATADQERDARRARAAAFSWERCASRVEEVWLRWA